MRKEVFKFIKDDNSILEKNPLKNLQKIKNYMLTNIINFGNVWIL